MTENTFITRPEYEARNAITNTDVARIEVKVDSLNSKVDSLRADSWKFVAVTCINFILGGSLVGVIQFLLARK
jgi:hypothetical protein